MDKVCVGCGKYFNPKWDKAVYCSISCSKTSNRNPNWKGGVGEKICPTCGKDFVPLNTHINRNRIFCSQKCSKIGKNNPQWKGVDVSYGSLHSWVERALIRPDRCSNCQTIGKVDAANISNEYKRDVSDWEWLCRKCHMIKDNRLKNLIARNKLNRVLGDRNCLFCNKTFRPRTSGTLFCSRKCYVDSPKQELRKINPYLLT